jgi:MinD-like ATPase involved in chromosome partitioning or flagellar assembly
VNDVEIALVVSTRTWADRLHRYVTDHGGARVRARPLQGRHALEETYDVLIAEDLTSFLTPRLVDDLHRSGRRLLGVYDPDEPTGRRRLLDIGADDVLPADATPQEFVRVLDVLRAGTPPTPTARERLPSGAAPDSTSRATTIAVGGPGGGCGVTEVAIALATHLQHHAPSVLLDLDVVAPAIAQRLGLPLHPNICAAIDAAEHLARAAETLLDVPEGPRALPGLVSGAMWRDVRPDDALTLLGTLRTEAGHLVCDIGTAIEDVPTSAGVGRHGVPRTIAGSADLVVAVGAPNPVGVTRLLGWVAELRTVAPDVPLLVAFNRVGGSRYLRAEVEREITRNIDVPALGFLPEDRRVLEAAWEGRPVRSGPFLRAVDRLGRAVRNTCAAREVAA